MRPRVLIAALVLLLCVAAPRHADAAPSPHIAALQVALRAKGLYGATIDGVRGPATAAAVRSLQRRKGLAIDGIAGRQTRRALGRLGRPNLGTRLLARGNSGWDVAALQFLLAWHGFPSGHFDGRLGERTAAAVRRFQRWADLPVDGVVGPLTLAALRRPPPAAPMALAWPVQAPVGSPFGPRGTRFHAGIDLPAASGTPVAAARSGTVAYAGWKGDLGKLVTVAHGSGVRTMYAHLARIDVRVGQRVATGAALGLMGSTGHSTGPHLHFEVRLRGAAVDPLTALA